MAVYDDTFMNNVTSIPDIFIGVGSSIGSPFLIGHMILLSFFFVFMAFSLGKEDFLSVLVANSLITSVLAILMFSINMVASYMVIAPIMIFVIALIFKLTMD